jgi:phosphatidylglycerol:prolipoprotein diacylglycerol transferase
MYPRLFGFVKSFGLMLAVSFLIGTVLSIRRGRRRNLTPDVVTDLVFAVLVSSLIGVRLFYVMTHLDDYDSLGRVFAIWDGGLTLYGGIVLATLTVWWLARRRQIPFLRVADVFAPGVVLGIGLTRIGCFLAGCCYGQPTDCPLGVHFPATAPATTQFGPVAVHPTQLYASAGGFLVFAALLLWERRPSPEGATFGRFLLLYGAVRFVIDFMRHYEPDQMIGALTNNQWLSLAMIAVGTILLWAIRGRPAV